MSVWKKVGISVGKILLYVLLMLPVSAVMVLFILPKFGIQFDQTSMSPTSMSTPNGLLIAAAFRLVQSSIAAFVMIAIFDRKPPSAIGLRLDQSLLDFFFGSVVGMFVFTCAVVIAIFASFASFGADVSQLSMKSIVAGFIGLTMLAADEEIIFRGFILQELMSKFSLATSVTVSSLLFVVAHGPALSESGTPFLGALSLFASSVMFSLAYLATKSLWLPIGVHMGWNFAQGPLFGIAVSGFDFSSGWHPISLSGSEMMTGGSFGFEGSLFGVAGAMIGVLLMAMFGWPLRQASANEAQP